MTTFRERRSLGALEETWQDIQDSLAIATRIPIRDFWFNNLIPYPKTELYDWVSANNLFTIQPDVYFNQVSYWMNEPVFETPNLSVAQRRRGVSETAKLKSKVKEHYFRRRLARFGLIGNIIAALGATDFVQNKLISQSLIKRVALALFERL